jgi:hypothetical protein
VSEREREERERVRERESMRYTSKPKRQQWAYTCAVERERE